MSYSSCHFYRHVITLITINRYTWRSFVRDTIKFKNLQFRAFCLKVEISSKSLIPPYKFLRQLIDSFPNFLQTICIYIYIFYSFIRFEIRETKLLTEEKEREREQISAMQKDLYYHPDRKTGSFELPPSSLRLKSILLLLLLPRLSHRGE